MKFTNTFVYDGARHISPATLPGMRERTIVLAAATAQRGHRFSENHRDSQRDRSGSSRNFDRSVRREPLSLFPTPPRVLIGAAGRLSPEKGYGVLVDAAVAVLRDCPDAGFLHFGDGPLRAELATKANRLGLSDRFVFGGFRTDLWCAEPGFRLAVIHRGLARRCSWRRSRQECPWSRRPSADARSDHRRRIRPPRSSR